MPAEEDLHYEETLPAIISRAHSVSRLNGFHQGVALLSSPAVDCEDIAMAHVSALFRYPVKGFTPESMQELTIQPDGRVRGDRVLAFRFSNARLPENRDGLDYWPKSKGLSLQDFPSIARLRLTFNEDSQRITLKDGDALLLDTPLDEAGREELLEIVTTYVLASSEGKRLSREGSLPLSLVGDGKQSRFQDRARGFVTVHSAASLAQLNRAIGMQLDDRRFRSNVVIDGLAPGEELEWSGRFQIGEVSFAAQGPIVRCLATHANPDTGERDAPVLKTLTGALEMTEPRFGRLLLPFGLDSTGAQAGAVDTGFVGGVIRIGDSVTVDQLQQNVADK